MYTFNDDSYVPKIINSKFGLNLAKLEEIKYIAADEAEGTGEAIEFNYDIDGEKRSARKYAVTKAYDDNGNEVTDPAHEAMEKERNNLVGSIYHMLKPYFGDRIQQVAQSFNQPVAGLKGVMDIFMKYVTQDYKNIPVHLFLQYSWNIKGDNNKSYLEIPKNLKHGHFVSAALPGEWKQKVLPEEKEGKYLIYENEKGEIHPIYKNKWFMESNFAKEQTKPEGQTATAVADPSVPPPIVDAPQAANVEETNSGTGVTW